MVQYCPGKQPFKVWTKTADIEFAAGGRGGGCGGGGGGGGGVQSPFCVKPFIGYVRLGWGFDNSPLFSQSPLIISCLWPHKNQENN